MTVRISARTLTLPGREGPAMRSAEPQPGAWGPGEGGEVLDCPLSIQACDIKGLSLLVGPWEA
jgi:hypothetical protein